MPVGLTKAPATTTYFMNSQIISDCSFMGSTVLLVCKAPPSNYQILILSVAIDKVLVGEALGRWQKS